MLALAAGCLWAGSSATAQVVTRFQPQQPRDIPTAFNVKPTLRLDASKYDIRENGRFTTYMPKQNRMQTRAAGEVEVRCVFEYDANRFTPSSAMIYNKELTVEEYYDYENNFLTFSIPVGTYDLYSSYWNSAMAGSLVHIIKERVNISKDTIITFNPAEATKRIHVESVMANGEVAKTDLVKYADDYMSYEVLEKGNTNDVNFFQYIILDDYGTISAFMGNMGWRTYESEDSITDRSNLTDFLVNEVSDRYTFAVSHLMTSGNNVYVVKHQQKGTAGELLTNEPQSYIPYEETFQPSPLGKNSPHRTGFYTLDLINEVNEGGWQGNIVNSELAESNPVQMYIAAPKEMEGNLRFNIMVYPMYSDYEYTYTIDFGDGMVREETAYCNIIGLPVFVSQDGIEYVNKGHDAYGNYSFQIPETEGDILEYPGHPAFSYTDAEKTGTYGNSCPINVFMAQNYYDSDYFNWKVSYLSPCYIGRLGEIRMSDYQALQMSLKYNGEEVENDYNQLSNVLASWAENKQPEGEVDLTLTNGNVEVDGLAGRNVTRVVFDQRKEDWTAPTLQMLHFKGTDGKITDRFNTPADGVLEFCGGDFNFHFEDRFRFDCKEQTVAVSYSPYGQDAWTALPVEEVPELYRMPGFGYFYRGSLAAVSVESDNHWYDLKITLTDASGNLQEQTISPAFRIDNVTGIAEAEQTQLDVRQDGDRLSVSGTPAASLDLYAADGTLVAQEADAVARPVRTDRLAPGIYVAKARTADGQTVVRKVTVR